MMKLCIDCKYFNDFSCDHFEYKRISMVTGKNNRSCAEARTIEHLCGESARGFVAKLSDIEKKDDKD